MIFVILSKSGLSASSFNFLLSHHQQDILNANSGYAASYGWLIKSTLNASVIY
jgi:hypothetical protein